MDIANTSRAHFNSPPSPSRLDVLSAYSFPGPRPHSAFAPTFFPLYDLRPDEGGSTSLGSAPPGPSNFILQQEKFLDHSSAVEQLPRSLSNAGFENYVPQLEWDTDHQATYSALGRAVLDNRVEHFAVPQQSQYSRTIYSPRQQHFQLAPPAPTAPPTSTVIQSTLEDVHQYTPHLPQPVYSAYRPDMVYESHHTPAVHHSPLPPAWNRASVSPAQRYQSASNISRSPERWGPYPMSRTTTSFSDTEAYRFGTHYSTDSEQSVDHGDSRLSTEVASSSSSSIAERPSGGRSQSTPAPRRKARASRLANPALFHPTPALMLAPELAEGRRLDASYSTGTSLTASDDCADLPTKKSRGRQPLTASELLLPSQAEPELTLEEQAYAGVTKTGKAKKVWRCKVPECQKLFKRSEHLKRHVRSIHTDERPFQCRWPGCGRYFSRHDNLSQHLRVHRTPVMTDEDFSAMLEFCFTQQVRVPPIDAESSDLSAL